MKFKFWLLILILSSCVKLEPDVIVEDDGGFEHHTPPLSRDTRGKHHFPKEIQATGKKKFVFDPKISAWAAYDTDGLRIRTGAGSGGKDFCDDENLPCRTVSGSFKVYSKRGEDCRSGEYPVATSGGAKMPYCMYFYRGYTIHAAFRVPQHPSSHGCIRVWPSAARWLNEEFMSLGTEVIVLSYS